MSCVYKIDFVKSSFDLSDDYSKLSDIDKEKIADISDESFLDLDIDKKYVIYLIVSPIEMKGYVNVLNDNNIDYKIKDLSKDILHDKINIEDELYQRISPLMAMRYSYFIDDLNQWIYNNLDIDIVLDKISLFGINSLRTVEKKFLSNYSC